MKIWKKTTFVKNMNSGNVCFSIEEVLGGLAAGDILELYKPKLPKTKKNLRGKMVITQTDIDKMTLEKDKETGEQYYMMSYTLTK